MRLPYDQHTIVQARQLGNARERSWQPHWLSLSMRAHEPRNDKQTCAVCVPQPSCSDIKTFVLLRNKHEVRRRPIPPLLFTQPFRALIGVHEAGLVRRIGDGSHGDASGRFGPEDKKLFKQPSTSTRVPIKRAPEAQGQLLLRTIRS